MKNLLLSLLLITGCGELKDIAGNVLPPTGTALATPTISPNVSITIPTQISTLPATPISTLAPTPKTSFSTTASVPNALPSIPAGSTQVPRSTPLSRHSSSSNASAPTVSSAVTATSTHQLSAIGCKLPLLNPNDGRDGFTWKESSPPRHVATLLFPGKFQVRFKLVKTISGGQLFDRFRYRELFTVHGKPYRQIWDGTKSTSLYTQNVVLYADGNCWLLKDPTQRID